MDSVSALAVLGALSQITRLDTYRLLTQVGPDGMAVGEIARRLEVPQNLMSSHLRILSRAGLLSSRRDGKSIFYRVDPRAWDEVVDLMKQAPSMSQAAAFSTAGVKGPPLTDPS